MGEDRQTQAERRQNWVARTLGHSVHDFIPSPGRLGYHPPREHTVVPITACPVARPEIEAAIGQLPVVPGLVTHLELRSDGQRVVGVFSARSGARPKVQEWIKSLPADALNGADLAVDGTPVRGTGKVELTTEGITHRLSPGTFYQVNLEINALLVRDVVAAVLDRSPTQVLDAYAGAGNLSLPLAAQGVGVTQIESHPAAVKDSRATALRHGLTVDARVQKAQDFSAGDAFFDLAILDPPRAGAGELMAQILMTRPAAMVMVSCNPHTLTRDMRQATEQGYRVSMVRVYEMFPQTEHAEVLAVLDR